MGIARKGGGVKDCQDGLEHFFPTLPGGVKACQDGLEHFFSTFARLTEYRTKTFRKGASPIGPDSFGGAITKVFNEILADLKIICDFLFQVPFNITDQISEMSLEFYIIGVPRQ